MDDLGIGRLITDNNAHRDAIHVAVAPVVAAEKLYPGQHVGVEDGRGIAGGTHIGIVDPFLPGPVFPEQRFWLFLFVGSITSLRHHWEHPAFSDGPSGPDALASREDPETSVSVAWLRAYASELGLSYDDLMEGADAWIEHGGYLNRGSLLEGIETSEKFWFHYKAVTGRELPRNRHDNFFSCSC